MTKTSMIRFIILGLLGHEDLSGYDIKKRFDNTISLFWENATLSQIYPLLQGLEDKGLVRKRVVPDDEKKRPPKKVYSLTRRGTQEYRELLSKPVDTHEPNMFQTIQVQILRFYLGESLSKKRSIALVEEVSEAITRILDSFEHQRGIVADELKSAEKPEEIRALRYRLFTLDLIKSLGECHIDWSESVRRRIRLLPKDE